MEAIELETDRPLLAGKMKFTVAFVEAGPATDLTVFNEDIPRGIRLEDDHVGVGESLRKLAARVGA